MDIPFIPRLTAIIGANAIGKQHALFTDTPERGARTKIAPLYGLLAAADVRAVAVAVG